MRGEWPEVELTAAALCSAWGDVRITFEHLHAADVQPDTVRPPDKLVFDAVDGGTSFVHTLQRLEHLELEHVPAGKYAMTLITAGGLSEYPCTGGFAEVVADATASISFDMTDARALAISVRDEREELFEGEASFGIRCAASGASAFASFRRPPYVVEALLPGRYEVMIYKPFHRPETITVDLGSDAEAATAAFQQL